MASEILAGLGALKTAFDMAKGLKDINDAVIRNGAVIELQEQILAAQRAQAELIECIRHLEEDVAKFETWNTEKEKYELKQLAPMGAALAYAIKPDAQGSEPFHCICATCYQNQKKSILQFRRVVIPFSSQHILGCPVCNTEVHSVSWPPA
jgi:hypothetical protein